MAEQKRDGITPAMLLGNKEFQPLKDRFLAECQEKGLEANKRQARKWLERNNYRWLKAA